jgi:hypothetical protein
VIDSRVGPGRQGRGAGAWGRAVAWGRAGAVAAALVATLALPAIAAAHQLSKVFESRLPLAVYVAGAAIAVALSFGFVLLRDVRATPARDDGRRGHLPRWLALFLRAAGVVGWAWIVVQGLFGGGASDAEVVRLFLWVYGWVLIASLSALVGPAWFWLNPIATLYDTAAAGARRLGISGGSPAAYPAALGRWPAVAGFAAIVWLELVASGGGSDTLFLLVLGYTAFTLAMMTQFGRDEWLQHGEIFTAWFGLLGRLAPRVVTDPTGSIRRRPFASGLLDADWRTSDLVLVAIGTGSILFDGLSQTQIWVDAFGLPSAGPQTLLLAIFLGAIVLAALAVARLVGTAAMGAGLLPIAVGYLIAHYLTYLLIEGQRIMVAVSDPLQRGADLFGTAFYEPSGAWLPPSLVWTIQLLAVVGGHMLGAWAGHVVAAMHLEPDADASRSLRRLRVRQVPLAVLMVALTTLTLWSLGQGLFVPPASSSAAVAAPSTGSGDVASRGGAGSASAV